jgi:hypothetical protein
VTDFSHLLACATLARLAAEDRATLESEPVRVVEGQARPVGKPVRLASEAIRAIAEPGSDQ